MSDWWYPGELARQDGYTDAPSPTRITVTPKQALPPEMTLPPAPPRQNMLERNLPPAYTPLEKTQNAIASTAFDFTMMGALADMYDAYKANSPVDFGVATAGIVPVGKIIGKAPKAVAKIGDLAALPGIGHNKAPRTGVDFWADPPPQNYGDVFIQPGDARVSTRFPKPVQEDVSNPTGFDRKENPLRTHLSVGIEDMLTRSTPEQLAHNIGLVTKYPGFRHLKGLPPREAAERYLEQTQGNLRYIWDQSPKYMQERSPRWYEGAHRFVDALSERYGIPRRSAAGGTAVLSPQKDWFQNASLSERVGDIVTGANKRWNPDMLRFARQNEALQKGENWDAVKRIAGKSLDQIDDPLDRAVWVRLWDEVRNPRRFREMTPEGDLGGYVLKADGTPANVAWGSGAEVAKAIQMFESGGDMDTISRLLGSKHKVRSFYNNIEVPWDMRFGDVTADTHQVAAGTLRPLSGNTPEVAHNFGSSLETKYQPKGYQGTMNSAITGLQGTYPLQVEATRRLANELMLPPRGVQSGVWEPVRLLFTDTFKSDAKNVKAIDDIWKAYDRGEIGLEAARRAVFERAGGIKQPSWARSGSPVHDPKGTSTYR